MLKKLKIFIILSSCMGCVTVEKPIECPGTKMIGWARVEDMTALDVANYEVAKEKCPTRFPNKRSPCLKKFQKLGEAQYYAECGAPK